MAGLDGPDLTGQQLTWANGHTGHRIEILGKSRQFHHRRTWIVRCLDCPHAYRWGVHESVIRPMLEAQGL